MKASLVFPKGFFWGAATAAHQVEGGNFKNDWWEFEQRGKIRDGSSARIACDHYHLFEKDFALAESLGHNAHRLSLEWSRIQPKVNVWDKKEVTHYRQVLLSLKKHKLISFVTLHHFTNPLWFAKMGGWENPKSPEIFRQYVQFCTHNFSDLIDFWLTINEPSVYLYFGYLLGKRPPEKKNLLLAIKVAHNLMKAHHLAYQEIHKYQKQARVSFACDQHLYEPAKNRFSPEILITKIADYFNNEWYLKKAEGCLDFIGVNYYFYTKLNFSLLRPKTFFLKLQEGGPEGIYKFLLRLKKISLPIYITENGTHDPDDRQRPAFILRNLKWIHQAIQEGADVRGYLHWTFMDNFEWDGGLFYKMGLCQTNFKTLRRMPRKSAKMYKEIIEANGITKKIVRKYQPKLSEEIFQ